jgi:hypothetical protein
MRLSARAGYALAIVANFEAVDALTVRRALP